MHIPHADRFDYQSASRLVKLSLAITNATIISSHSLVFITSSRVFPQCSAKNLYYSGVGAPEALGTIRRLADSVENSSVMAVALWAILLIF